VALDLDKKMRMEVDVLDYAIGEMLLIECKDKQSVAYLSNLIIRQKETMKSMTRKC